MFRFRKFYTQNSLVATLKHKVAVRRNGHFAFSSFARTGTLCWLTLQVTPDHTQRAKPCAQRLVASTYPRGPQVLEQLLADVAGRIGGQAAILAALVELEAQRPRTDRSRRRQGTAR